MSENIKDIMGVTMDKIKTMASADTIIGDPIVLSEDVTCIPVSKVSYGFASGGSDFAIKNAPQKSLFGGGGGAGMTVTPVAFLVLQNGKVKIMGIGDDGSAASKAITALPELFDKISDAMKQRKENQNNA